MKPSLPRVILGLEAFVVLAASLIAYFSQGWDLVMFVILLLVPDVSMIGYLKDKKLGSITYNIGHTYLLPAILFSTSFIYEYTFGVQIALVWFAHIGMDRVLGFGLKYPTAFKDTHLHHV